MNTRGFEAAIRLRSSIYVLELLKALIAYRLGRPELLMKPSAFKASRHLNFQVMLWEQNNRKELLPARLIQKVDLSKKFLAGIP